MKMVKVYNATGDEILACHCDLEYYESIGWTQEAPKKAAAKAKPIEVEEQE